MALSPKENIRLYVRFVFSTRVDPSRRPFCQGVNRKPTRACILLVTLCSSGSQPSKFGSGIRVSAVPNESQLYLNGQFLRNQLQRRSRFLSKRRIRNTSCAVFYLRDQELDRGMVASRSRRCVLPRSVQED